ncbi:hypothetical protein GW755_00835 [bacterium]|nr:hypothetical protein [bacterium]
MKYIKNKKIYVFIPVSMGVLFIVLGYLFFDSYFLKQKKVSPQNPSLENSKEYSNYSEESLSVYDKVIEQSLTDYFNKNSTDSPVSYSSRSLPLEYLQDLPKKARYSIQGTDYVRHLAYLKQVVKEGQLYKFDLVGGYVADVNYSDKVKLLDADYGFDSDKNLVRNEFFPVDTKNINLLKVGAPVYLVFTEDQVDSLTLFPTEVVILNYE